MRRIVVVALLAGCAAEPASAPAVVTPPTAERGGNQAGTPGYLLADSLEIRVVDANGESVRGVAVTWETQPTNGVVSPGSPVTNANGVARAAWRMPAGEGTHWASARVGSQPAARFAAHASSAELSSVGGTADALCGVTLLGAIRCWRPPTRDSIPMSGVVATTDRTVALAFARDKWCAVSVTGRITCFTIADLYRTGRFVPAQAFASLLTSFGPQLVSLAAAADGESPPVFCGLTSGGEAWCWGNNAHGQMGDGTIGGVVELPVKVTMLDTFRELDVSEQSACGITVSGAPWCWGSNATALIGPKGGLVGSPIPRAVATADRYFTMALTLGGTACGLRGTTGQAACWGRSTRDALGRPGVTADDPSPRAITSDNVLVSIARNGAGFSAVSIDRELVIWGPVPNGVSTEGPGYVTATRIPFDERFTGMLRGGTNGYSCMRSLFGGARCVDVYVLGPAAARERASIARPAQFGVPR
ncbi:MAG: hypothetical protein ABIR59_13920 [Gemmatimonadales bacterium]